jgi:uncharacterized membrane protein YjjB (DUF3815 family)
MTRLRVTVPLVVSVPAISPLIPAIDHVRTHLRDDAGQ